ncbi:MAG: DivIVA domain-containing protein [Acidimicrobiia bacterium]|nr:DivIVA domain-containing protein [Acidimicrobiia bacterium]
MPDEVSPSQARARQFDVVRRGYDRAQVDTYIEELTSLLDDLESAAVEAKASAIAIGIDDPQALANELGRIGGEVSAILEASRAAAEGLRKRAAKDAEQWRKTAETESAAMLADAVEQSQSMRAAAWNEGTSMLSSAIGAARALLDEAQEDAMFMRAEAERDALRLTSDARREKDEVLRAARLESESIIAEARAESDGVLAAAQKQADAAQDRARALEERRAELLTELETARASISHLEDEIDSRRQALEVTEEPEHFEIEARHSDIDVGSVKIVAPSKAVTLKPVDTDEIVAEVVAMRFAAAEARAAELEPVEPETVAVISPPQPEPDPKPEPMVERPAAEQPAPPPPAPPPDVKATDDDISSLFAKLRDEGESEVRSQTSDVSTAVLPPGGTDPAESDQGGVRAREPRPEQKSEVSTPVLPSGGTDSAESDQGGVRAREPRPEQEPAAESRTAETLEPAPLTVVPSIHNAALKQVKKVLVELQNETLEALRTDTSWVPSGGFAGRFDEAFVEVADAAGSRSGKTDASAFASDLEDAVTTAIEEARTAGKGERAVAAQASKVFRLWRTDEAERRLRSIG